MFKPKLSNSVNVVEALGLVDGEYRYRLEPNFEQTIKKMKELGFYAVELDVMCGYAWRFEEYAEKACKICKKYGVVINSIHMPFNEHWTDLISLWEADRQEIIKWCVKVFKKLDKFDIRAYVFHPNPMVKVTPETYEERMKILCDTVDRIQEQVKGYICLENMAGGSMMTLLKECVDYTKISKNGYMVIDVNHFLKDDAAKAILTLGDKVKTLHISDCDMVKERHWLPGEGKIDFMAVISALEQIGYDGTFNYELLKNYSLEQVKENYENLFNEYNK